MKKGIHPNYDDAMITCACGNVIHTRSTVKDMHVNTCSSCHPFFTGQAAFIDTEGRVEQFKKRYGKK
ncbi:50S ribosomal protein L31 [Verrucomicrobiota bacterium]